VSLQRWDEINGMVDKHDQGDLVLLDDVIKFLEENNACDGGISTGNCTCTAIGLLEDERDKGENKTNLWTSRPLTEEDEEHYGLEGENK